MHDIRAIRENPAALDAALARRGEDAMSSAVLSLDAARRARITAAETAQAEQNKASKEVGAAKAKGDEAEFERLRALVGEKKADVARLQTEAKDLDAQLTDMLARLPNIPADDVPDGADEDDNVEVNRWGGLPNFDFDPKEHFEITGVAASMATIIDSNYGLGVVVLDGFEQIRHLGSNRGYKSGFVGVPSTMSGIVTMTNAESGARLRSQINRSAEILFGWSEPQPQEAP